MTGTPPCVEGVPIIKMICAMERFHALGRIKPSPETAPATAPPSPKAILLAKSETHTIKGQHALANSVASSASPRENDFASSISFGESGLDCAFQRAAVSPATEIE
jgi:hypothetical protein